MYKINEQGRLNNYALNDYALNDYALNNQTAQPVVYAAAYPYLEEQRRYFFQGAIAVLFLTSILFTVFAMS
jgi:hypothetical protein